MTAFGLLWDFLKIKDPAMTQDTFAYDIGLGETGDRTIRNWKKSGFSPAKITPYEIYKVVFITNNKFDALTAKHFLNHIEKKGFEKTLAADGKVDEKEFELFFSDFLMSDTAKVKSAPSPVAQTDKFSMPSHFRERKTELDHLLEDAFSSSAYRVHAIVGERGLGKTTLALNYANEAASGGKFGYIFDLSYKGTIKETVANLEKDKSEGVSTNDRFEKNLIRIKKMRDSAEVLLIIDNYDNPELVDELAEDNADYVRLLETGCKILITSTSDLGRCHAIDDHVTYLSHFDTDTLTNLFFDVKGKRNDDEADVRELIEDCLLRNTYLVVLSAELAKQNMTARDIIRAIRGMKADDTDIITTQKDGRRQDEKTLIDHFCCVLENNKIINPDDADKRREMHGVLGILALLPIGGIPVSDFEEVACPYSKRKTFKRNISRLQNHNLAFENGGRIYLQPVVKEYLARELLLFGKDTYYYLTALTEKLDVDTYDAGMMYWVNISEAAYAVVGDEHTKEGARMRTLELSEKFADADKADESIGASTVLCSRIAACYSAVNMYGKAYEYGVLALPGLKDICHSQYQLFDKLTLATCFNVVGFAFLHGDTKYYDRNMKTAFECINRYSDLVNSVEVDEKNAVKVRIAHSKLHGLLAAYYLKNNDYKTALEHHTLALHEREQLLEQDPYSDKYRSMIAFMYRGIGTDYFYISRTADRSNNLKLSYENNLRSVQLFEDLYGSARLETVEGYNRLVGTALALIGTVKDDELSGMIGLTFAELTDSLYNYLTAVFEFYGSSGLDFNREMADSLKKAIELNQIMTARGALGERCRAFNARAVETVKNIPTANGVCLGLLPMLEKE